MTKQRNHLGFTLIELMITVAIVGILAAIALPAYKNYVIRSKLVAGTNSLSSLRSQMEQYYLDNRTYVTVSSPTIVTPCVQYATSASKSNLFNVGCLATPTSAAYILTAQGTGVVANAEYRIDQGGTMTTVSLPTGWGTPASGNTCWIMRKGDTC